MELELETRRIIYERADPKTLNRFSEPFIPNNQQVSDRENNSRNS